MRAMEVARPGEHIGLFEIFIWCAIQQRRVYLHLQEGSIDIVSDLCPQLMRESWRMQPFSAGLVATHIREDGGLMPAGWHNTNHYVACQRMAEKLPAKGDNVVAHMAPCFCPCATEIAGQIA